VIVNELVSNACKYAYAADRAPAKGAGRSCVDDGDGHFVLQVEDDGCGMPADGSIKGTGLGSKLVNVMAASLKAAIDYDPSHAGVRATLIAAAA
jgi:two-component sensor histidine kinase